MQRQRADTESRQATSWFYTNDLTLPAHEGIKAAVSRIFTATWQRGRVHFMRNALAHAGRSGKRVVSAFIATAFAQDDAAQAKAQ